MVVLLLVMTELRYGFGMVVQEKGGAVRGVGPQSLRQERKWEEKADRV